MDHFFNIHKGFYQLIANNTNVTEMVNTKENNSKDYHGKENVKETFDSLPFTIKIIHSVRSGGCQNHLQDTEQNVRPDSGNIPELKNPWGVPKPLS